MWKRSRIRLAIKRLLLPYPFINPRDEPLLYARQWLALRRMPALALRIPIRRQPWRRPALRIPAGAIILAVVIAYTLILLADHRWGVSGSQRRHLTVRQQCALIVPRPWIDDCVRNYYQNNPGGHRASHPTHTGLAHHRGARAQVHTHRHTKHTGHRRALQTPRTPAHPDTGPRQRRSSQPHRQLGGLAPSLRGSTRALRSRPAILSGSPESEIPTRGRRRLPLHSPPVLRVELITKQGERMSPQLALLEEAGITIEFLPMTRHRNRARLTSGDRAVHFAWGALNTDPNDLVDTLLAQAAGYNQADGDYNYWLRDHGIEDDATAQSTFVEIAVDTENLMAFLGDLYEEAQLA